ncbi:hypothetical protein RJ640_022606 [Escallonia rubra]|uniref:PNPLA domain-containing protein n=1 Tax=Escallonia rubra TaxID=112253 RepID=A0AA88R5L8_9ASTE|nr:hypothetical protein RJ640_022606 [Escallonia rubra]
MLQPKKSSPAKNADSPIRVKLRTLSANEGDRILGRVEQAAVTVIGGKHCSEESADSGAGDDVKELGDTGVSIAGFGLDLVLQVDQGGPGDNAGRSASVDAEHTRLLAFVVYVKRISRCYYSETTMKLSKVTFENFSKLEQKWLYHYEGKKTSVLSIDAGGTTGIVAGTTLIHLENQIQAKTGDAHSRIAKFFDIVTGTGIGALFTAMLTADDSNGRLLYSAKNAVAFVGGKSAELYTDWRVSVFRRRWIFSAGAWTEC